MIGKISKIANQHGSTWGRIQPEGSTRELFFNAASLIKGSDYHTLEVGMDVEFSEEPDRANGMHAVSMKVITPATGEVKA